MSPSLLQARDLYCERDERVLFAGVSLELAAGDLLQIEGANGAGKTTLLRALAGLNRHVEGSVHWRGASVLESPAEFFAETLVLGHQTGIKLALSPRENLDWIVALRTGQTVLSHAIDQALDAVGLADHAALPCHCLSAGQKRRVALARLFLEPATLWVLDEPFSAIDRAGVAVLETLLCNHVRRGGVAIVVTHHDLALRDAVSHRRLMLGAGRNGAWSLT